jgi:hypothetical protein
MPILISGLDGVEISDGGIISPSSPNAPADCRMCGMKLPHGLINADGPLWLIRFFVLNMAGFVAFHVCKKE